MKNKKWCEDIVSRDGRYWYRIGGIFDVLYKNVTKCRYCEKPRPSLGRNNGNLQVRT